MICIFLFGAATSLTPASVTDDVHILHIIHTFALSITVIINNYGKLLLNKNLITQNVFNFIIERSILRKNQLCSKQHLNTCTYFDTFSPTEKLPKVVLPTTFTYEYRHTTKNTKHCVIHCGQFTKNFVFSYC